MRVPRLSQRVLASVLVALLAASTLVAALPRGVVSADTTVVVPAQASTRQTTAAAVELPGNVTAVEGRVLVSEGSLELVGVAPVGRGEALTPVPVEGGYAFAAFDLRPRSDKTILRLIFAPLIKGQLEFRVVLDAVADIRGRRITLGQSEALARLVVENGTRRLTAPKGAARPAPGRPAGPTRDVYGRGVIGPDDLDLVRGTWYSARQGNASCVEAQINQADANGDGCLDVVDLQAVHADQATRTGDLVEQSAAGTPGIDLRFMANLNGAPPAEPQALDAPMTFTVTNAGDTPDANVGNRVCADSQGRCTLRAALNESNWNSGVDRINFDLPGTAPVQIQVGGWLPVGSASGGVIIDGYTQPGSRVNTATFGSNAIPGVELRGTGNAMTFVLYVPRSGSTVRGLLINNAYRSVFLDTPNATNNRVVGTFIGFHPDNSLPPRGRAGVWLNTGASQNLIGTPALADRNVIGNYDKAIYSYGSGTNGNISQNNLLCVRPNGQGAICQIGVDHDFGPKGSLVGGTGPNERNIIGPTTINGMEFSHGWNPDTGQSTTAWQINDHRVIDNWIGFRQDGRYDPAYRVAQNVPTFDNGQGINIFDGSNNNLVEGNHIASAHDGLTIGISNSTGNMVRNNIVGRSPHGETAPGDGWGIYLYSNTHIHTIEGNVFDNMTDGGVGLLDHNIDRIRISRNIVTNTNGPAIYLQANPNIPSSGANNLMAVPSIGSTTETSAAGAGVAGATVEVFRASRALGEFGLPVEFLGSAVVASNGSWNVTYSRTLQTGERVTALQIRTNGDTSQVAANVYAGGPPPPPTANFTFAQQPGTLRVDFTDTSTGLPSSWSWNFGDGTTSTQQNPSRVYDAGGEYTVSLTVTNTSGSNTRTRTVTVQPLPPGTVLARDAFTRNLTNEWGEADIGGVYTLDGMAANFNVTGGTGTVTMPSAFSNRSGLLNDVWARDVEVLFRVRASKVASGNSYYVYAPVRRNANHAYRPKIILQPNGSVLAHAGVVVNNSESSVAPAVTVPGLTPAANAFVWVRAEVVGVSPTTIRVKAWADGQTEPSNWHFSATNSTSAVQRSGAVGLRVYVDAINNAPVTFGFDDYLVKTPGVAAPPPAPTANFSFSQQAGTLTIDLTDTSTGSPTSWSWSFGDGTSSTQRNPTKTYASADTYSVSLTASNASGSNTVTKSVTVVPPPPPPPPPTADFSFSQQAGTLTVNFTDASTGSPTSWSWSFGDGTSSTQQNTAKTYAAGGDYTVSLTASNSSGSHTISKQVNVEQPTLTTYASDTFGRTVSNGWGSANTGGAYTLEGTAANFSVGGGVGSLVLPSTGATRAVLLAGVSARDVDVTFRVRSDKTASGGAQYVYAVARRNGNNAYRPKIILNTNGSVAVHSGVLLNNSESSVAPAIIVPGLTHGANTFIWVRAQLSGSSPTTIRVKAWADGQAEPSGWHFTATNSAAAVQSAGSVGLRAYMSSTNAPVTFSFDDYLVTSVP
jgi:PKD repeat protein